MSNKISKICMVCDEIYGGMHASCPFCTSDTTKSINNCMIFAIKMHGLQRRRHQIIPYSTHPIQVAKKVSDWGCYDFRLIKALILHDLVEDVPEVTMDMIQSIYGIPITDVVRQLTHVDGEPKRKSMERAANSSVRALVGKVADRLCNFWDHVADSSGSSIIGTAKLMGVKRKRRAAIYLAHAMPIIKSVYKRRQEVRGFFTTFSSPKVMNRYKDDVPRGEIWGRMEEDLYHAVSVVCKNNWAPDIWNEAPFRFMGERDIDNTHDRIMSLVYNKDGDAIYPSIKRKPTNEIHN